MTRTERAKIAALGRLRILPGLWDARFVRSLAYMVRTAPNTVFSPGQRYQLDSLIWRYRRQLSGRDDLGFLLPETEPRQEDYERPARPQRQRMLL
jgi:hypothetical protein